MRAVGPTASNASKASETLRIRWHNSCDSPSSFSLLLTDCANAKIAQLACLWFSIPEYESVSLCESKVCTQTFRVCVCVSSRRSLAVQCVAHTNTYSWAVVCWDDAHMLHDDAHWVHRFEIVDVSVGVLMLNRSLVYTCISFAGVAL